MSTVSVVCDCTYLIYVCMSLLYTVRRVWMIQCSEYCPSPTIGICPSASSTSNQSTEYY